MNLLEKYKRARIKDIDFDELNRNNVCIVKYPTNWEAREKLTYDTQDKIDAIVFEHRDCRTTDKFFMLGSYREIPEELYFNSVIENKNITYLDLYTGTGWYYSQQQDYILRQLGHHHLKFLKVGQEVRGGDWEQPLSYYDLIPVLEGDSFHTLTSLELSHIVLREPEGKDIPNYHHLIEIIARMPNLKTLDIAFDNTELLEISGKDFIDSKIKELYLEGRINDSYALFQNPHLRILTVGRLSSRQSNLEELKEAIRNNKSLIKLSIYRESVHEYIDALNYIPTLRYLFVIIESNPYQCFDILSHNTHLTKFTTRIEVEHKNISEIEDMLEPLWNNIYLHECYLEYSYMKEDKQYKHGMSRSKTLRNNLTITNIEIYSELDPAVTTHLQTNRVLESIISKIIHRLWWHLQA